MTPSSYEKFVALLSRLAPEVWMNAVRWGPGWKWMEPVSKQWEFGPFSALFLILGLNDYQTKGTADKGYWPKVIPLIPNIPPRSEPLALIEILAPFFRKERFAQVKVQRLDAFARSELARELWFSDHKNIAHQFVHIWHQLAETMGQDPTKKTIAFAMKCLGYALLMFNESEFEYGAIPLPVDSRVCSLSRRLGLPLVSNSDERRRWSHALALIRTSNASVNMMHLDSVLWQIGTLPRSAVEQHLFTLGAGDAAHAIAELLDDVDVGGISCA